MKIGVFTDPHYALADRLLNTRRPALSLGKLKEACEAFKNAQVDAIFCLGDWISVYGSEEDMTDRLREMAEAVHTVGVPVFTCMGNHDREIFTKEDFEKISQVTTAPCVFEDEYSKVILLDANYKRNQEPWPDHYEDWTQTCIPKDEVEWLKAHLGSEQKCTSVCDATRTFRAGSTLMENPEIDPDKKQKCTVLLHQPLDETISPEHVVENAKEIKKILKESGKVDLVLQGHYHFGGDQTEEGIRYLTLNAMCEEEVNSFYIFEV